MSVLGRTGDCAIDRIRVSPDVTGGTDGSNPDVDVTPLRMATWLTTEPGLHAASGEGFPRCRRDRRRPRGVS